MDVVYYDDVILQDVTPCFLMTPCFLTVGFIRNGCFGGRKAGNQLVAGGVPQKTVL